MNTRIQFPALGLAIFALAPATAAAATPAMHLSRLDSVDGAVSEALQARSDFRSGVACEAELNGDIFDCAFIRTEGSQEGVFIDHLLVHEACQSGRFCEDGTLSVLTIVHDVVATESGVELMSDIWLTDVRSSRRNQVATLYTVGESAGDGSVVRLEMSLMTDEWTDLGAYTVERSDEESSPDALSWENTLAGASAGAGFGAALGGPPGALVGALNGAAISMVLEVYDENKEKDSDGDSAGNGECDGSGETDGGGATEEGGEDGGDVKSDSHGSNDTGEGS
jgi:hypothetical protein